MNDFLERLKKRKGDSDKTNGVPTGVLPKDAPSRETVKTKVKEEEKKKSRFKAKAKVESVAEVEEEEEKEAEEKEAAPKKRGRPKGSKTKAKAAETEVAEETEEAEEKKTIKANPKSNGFVLYIDCMPSKDVNDVEPTLFEDWFSPLVYKMNEFALEERQVRSYLLLSFGEQKAVIEAAISEVIDKLPPAMIITSGVLGAKEAQAALTPHATQVVRALR